MAEQNVTRSVRAQSLCAHLAHANDDGCTRREASCHRVRQEANQESQAQNADGCVKDRHKEGQLCDRLVVALLHSKLEAVQVVWVGDELGACGTPTAHSTP